MTVLLVVLMTAVVIWLVLSLRAQRRRGPADATADFSRALTAIAPSRGRRRRRVR